MFFTIARSFRLLCAAAALAGLFGVASLSAQVALSGGTYTQDFNSLAGGLPAGWTVATGATATGAGTGVTPNVTAVTWGSTTGQWGNMAAADNNGTPFSGAESTAIQNAAADRALAIRQTGAFGDPGASASFNFSTVDAQVSGISFSAQMLSVQTRSTVWSLQYGVGAAPSSWTTLTTYTDPALFGSTGVSASGFGAVLDNQASVWVRIVALAASTGAGSRDSFGIDDFTITTTTGGVIAPTITLDPVSQAVTAGVTVQFTAAANGTAPLTYHWRKDGSLLSDGGIISGAESTALTLTGVSAADAGAYDFVATNSAGPATSAAATLVVNGASLPPTITTPPVAQSVPLGGTAIFTVAASGTAPFSYQWRKDGAPLSEGGAISGVTGTTLTITPVANADAGSYDVIVSNAVDPAAVSNAVALAVTPPAPATTDLVWNFGTAAGVATPAGLPFDITGGVLTSGNNNGTTTVLLTTTSASSGYTGSTGLFNAGAAARTGALNTGANGSAYFEFTLTPADNKELSTTGIAFGSRSTATGPQAFALYTSQDDFTAPIASGPLAALGTTSWGLDTVPLTGLNTGAGLDITFRLYGYNGAGSPAANTANWRIDDLKLTVTTSPAAPLPPTVKSVSPANGASGVVPGAAITVTFNKSAVVSASSFSLIGSSSGLHSVTVSGGPTVFTLTPTAPFALGETVNFTVLAAGVTDLSGQLHPATDFVSSFATLSPVPVAINAVQGSGLSSSYVGQTLIVKGVVVASFQGVGGIGGYYIETPQSGWDADPATSEGIYIFDNANSVTVGDLVSVAGTVVEFGTAPNSETELSPVIGFMKESSGNPLPPVTAVTLPFPNGTYAERYEGMLVTLPQTLTVTDNFGLGQYGELTLSNGRLPQPTNIVAPGAPAQAQLAANLLNQVILDDGRSPTYPDPTPYLSSANPAVATRRTGSTAAGVTGTFGNKFGAYVIEPTAAVTFADANPRSSIVPATGSGLRVAIGNVLNFFNGDGAGGGFPTSRGANTFAEYQAQRAKIIAGILGIAPDIMGLTEVENDRITNALASSYGPTSAIADIVTGLNASAPNGTTYAYIDASSVDIVSDVIHCAFIYRVETVVPVGGPAMLNDPSFTGVNIGIARNPLAQTFQQVSNGEKLTVSINHFKSKGSASSDPGAGGAELNADTGDGQGASNHVRKLQAQALVNWLATDPTGSGDPDFLIIGDLNAYAKEDPVTIIESAGYINLTEVAEGPGGYSYAFNGSFGHLDHALANGHLANQVVDAGTWHVNSDEPVYLDYNAEDKSAAQQTINAGTSFRYSDHDPVVVRLLLAPEPVAPMITTSPVAQTTTTGSSVTFSVTATGVPLPTYQWRRNGNDIVGANSASYTIAFPTSADAGSYDVVVTNGAGSVTSGAAILTVNAASASVTLSGLEYVYDGLPHPATATTAPEGLSVKFTYNGSTTPPVAPGWYTVVAAINSPGYTGSATGQLFIDVTSLVRHLSFLDGRIRGSLQLVTAESVTLGNGVSITGDLLVPGTPTVKKNGNATYGGTIDGTGAATPATATITLNNGSSLRHVVRRTNAQTLPVVARPPKPTGTRSVVLYSTGQSPGNFATLRNLTLIGNVGTITIPAGTYGTISSAGSTSIVLGVAGATTPAVYNLQGLILAGSSRVVIAGPVVVNLDDGIILVGSVGAAGHPEWLELNIASGSFTLLGNVTFHGYVTVPSGTVTITGSSVVTGRVIADRLIVGGSGMLADPEF